MKNDKYAELFKYCSPKSIFVVTWYGKLKILHCPITVIVKVKVGKLSIGDYVKVDEILLSTSGKSVFMIENQAYHYHYFDILTHL
ncbi:hypothetical protein [Seonamhaeicola marinus]|uniref:Uncharacterized protein n=1 Tax=Seonamhaeicola marinus TaxID=1912246 RepID=A0A5D0HSK8_9FLAO|nr:hypothetical protein [Seonamhaeicola marinus]TYA74235.1 hypothetical protein FUA24_12955 [Seonamhaeicola marinus]